MRTARLHFREARRRGAFTLIEVMIAMAILAGVVAAIYSSWVGIIKASKVGLDSAVASQRTRISMQIIQEALASAEMFQANADWYGFVAENGREASLSFVSRLPKSFPRSGKFGDLCVRRVEFAVEPDSDNHNRLVLRQTPILMEMDDDEKNHPVVLAKRVKEFTAEFLDPRVATNQNFAASSSLMWLDEWTETNQLPKLVKVTLQLEQESTRTVKANEALTCIINIPAVAVQTAWQMPTGQSSRTNRTGGGNAGSGSNQNNPGGNPGGGRNPTINIPR